MPRPFIALLAATAFMFAGDRVSHAETIADVVESFEGVIGAVRTWEGPGKVGNQGTWKYTPSPSLHAHRQPS
jgi:hypothetical protein